MELHEILSRLKGVKQSGGQYVACCPAHNDKRASLAVSEKDGKILLYCHAGCELDAILKGLGIERSALRTGAGAAAVFSSVPIEYTYTDIDGKAILKKIRMPNKKFFWQRPDGKGNWINGRGKTVPPIFNQYQAKKSKTVYIVEGEKDVLSLKDLGQAAVSFPDGAKSKWRSEYESFFNGKDVVIIQDNDNPGKEYARMVAEKVLDIACSVKIIDLAKIWAEIPEHADISDYIARFGKEAFAGVLGLVKQAEQFTPSIEDIADVMSKHQGKALNESILKDALKMSGISVRYNILMKDVDISGMPAQYSAADSANTLPMYMVDFLHSFEIKGARRETVTDYLNIIAGQNRYNPIEEYLNFGTWDKTDRLPEVFRILGITQLHYQTYIKKWLIQCVALGLNDENNPVGAEGVLVLQGAQGIAKTSFFRILTPFPRWFVEGAVINMTDKDSRLNALSGWITELGELDSTVKKEQSSLKAFITSPADKIRLPYAKIALFSPRMTSFCGTVNPISYLNDGTGNRRFWTIPIEKIDKAALFSLSKEWVQQLWFQMYEAYKQDNNAFRLTDAEMEQLQVDNKEYEIPLLYEENIRSLLNFSLPKDNWEWWRAADVAKLIPGCPDTRYVGKAMAKIAEELKGHSRYRKIVNGHAFYLLPKVHSDMSAWDRFSG